MPNIKSFSNKSQLTLVALFVLGFGLVVTLIASQQRQEQRSRAAETTSDQTITIGVNCTSTGQMCVPVYITSVQTSSVLKVNYSVGAQGCSSAKFHMLVDGTEKAVSGWTGWPNATAPFNSLPLSTGVMDLGPVTAGTHTIGIQGEGQT